MKPMAQTHLKLKNNAENWNRGLEEKLNQQQNSLFMMSTYADMLVTFIETLGIL